MYRSLFHGNYSSLRSLSSSPIVKHSNLASSPAIMTTIGATVSTLASPVKFPALSRFSSLISFNQSISQPKFNTESNSPAIIRSLSPPEKSPAISSNQSISQPKFSTASNSPAIISSLSSPTIITSISSPAIINSENLIRHSSYSTYVHSSSILSSLSSSSPETSIVKPLRPSVVTTRSYGRFPPMRGVIPVKPSDAMNTRTLNAKYAPAEEFPDNFVTPESAVAEIKLAVCKNPDSNSNRPAFKVHNLRSSYVDDKGNIVNLIREIPKKDRKFYEFLMKTAKQMIKLDMDLHCITDAELEQLWWPEIGDPQDFWATGLLKHSRFSLDEAITDYVSKTFELASPMINGTDDQPGLGEFLQMRGFTTGKYHDVAALMPALEDFFTVDAYPTFVGHAGYHPALVEVGVLTNKDCSAKIFHPMSTTIPQGKFLMRRL